MSTRKYTSRITVCSAHDLVSLLWLTRIGKKIGGNFIFLDRNNFVLRQYMAPKVTYGAAEMNAFI
jgi:hypothetical protein